MIHNNAYFKNIWKIFFAFSLFYLVNVINIRIDQRINMIIHKILVDETTMVDKKLTNNKLIEEDLTIQISILIVII